MNQKIIMNNISLEISSTNNLFRHYLLGESIRNIFIRLTIILLAIILVWCAIVCASIIHGRWQRKKQILKNSNTHHHLYDSTLSLTKKRSSYWKRNRRYSSISSLSSDYCSCCCCCCSIDHLFSQLKQRCGFWPSSSSSIVNENSIQQIASIPKMKQHTNRMSKNTHSTSNKVQIIVETINEPPIDSKQNLMNIGKRISLYRGGVSCSGEQLRNFSRIENCSQPQLTSNQDTSNSIIQLGEPKIRLHSPSISLPIVEIKDDQVTKKRLCKLHQFNTKATLFFHPITRRLSNVKMNPCLPSTNTIFEQQQHKPLLMVSSARELSTNDSQCHPVYADESTITDTSRTSSARHIPLVMITDTSSSNTNILELDTFEDQHHLVGDIERRLSQELRASYQPRHST